MQPIPRPDGRIHSEGMTGADIDWIPEGTRFGVDDTVFFHGKRCATSTTCSMPTASLPQQLRGGLEPDADTVLDTGEGEVS